MPRFRPSSEAILVAAITALFIALSVWWVLYDNRVPGGGDPGRHLHTALVAGEALGQSSLTGGFDQAGLTDLIDLGPNGSFFYPPLVHLIGGIPAALGLPVTDWGTIAINLIFVPMLAAGCFGVGRLVYGPAAGVLAAAFALGTPMVLSLFHVFLLDAPLAAAVAITLWPLLASDRFVRRRESVIAGALLGLAALIKTPAPLFLLGPVVVMLAAGGWRQWRNLALFALAALVVAGPYYAAHLGDVVSLSEQSTSSAQLQGEEFSYDPTATYSRFTLHNATYYGWVAVNLQYFLPLVLLFGVGLVVALREIRRRGVPELLAGVVLSYLAATFLLSLRDPRYTLPLVVYVAVLATGWITITKRAAIQLAAVTVLVAAITFNVGASVTDELPTIEWTLPGTEKREDLVDGGTLRILDDAGWTVGPPRPDPLWEDLLSAAGREGRNPVRITVREPAFWGTEPLGFEVFARDHGLEEARYDGLRRRPDLVINTWWTEAGLRAARARGIPAPCGTIEEGAGLPASSDPVTVSVAVQRRGPGGGLERWCDF